MVVSLIKSGNGSAAKKAFGKHIFESLESRIAYQKALVGELLMDRDTTADRALRYSDNYFAHNLYTLLNNLEDELSTLSSFLKVKNGSKRKSLEEHIDRVLGVGLRNSEVSLEQYKMMHQKFSVLFERGHLPAVGTPYQDVLLEKIITSNHDFLIKAKEVEYTDISENVKEEFRYYLTLMRELFDFNLQGTMEKYVGALINLRREHDFKIKSPDRYLPSLDNFTPLGKPNRRTTDREKGQKERSELKKAIFELDSWDDADKTIAEILYKQNKFTDARVFGIRYDMFSGSFSLVPKERQIVTKMDELIGYDDQKELLRKNTQKLIDGKRCNNAFIYGPPGNGKSSMVNSLLHEYEGLKVIEIEDKDYIRGLPSIFEEVELMPQKYILVWDEVKVDSEDEFTKLKKVIEGTFSKVPDNACLYVISNDEESLTSDGSNDDVRMSLASRFGLKIYFPAIEIDQTRPFLEHFLSGTDISFSEDHITGFSRYCEEGKIIKPTPRDVRNYVGIL